MARQLKLNLRKKRTCGYTCKGRDSKGRIKKGYKLTKRGVCKAR